MSLTAYSMVGSTGMISVSLDIFGKMSSIVGGGKPHLSNSLVVTSPCEFCGVLTGFITLASLFRFMLPDDPKPIAALPSRFGFFDFDETAKATTNGLRDVLVETVACVFGITLKLHTLL